MRYVINCFLCLCFFLSLCHSSVYAGAGIIPAPPQINATAYLLMDFNSKQMLAEKNIDEKLQPASLTKVMTVYVIASELAAGRLSMDEKVIVSEKAWKMGGSRMFIEVNKEVSVGDLLKGIIIQSGNDASVAMAEYISGTEEVFSELMNHYSNKLGLKNTHYTNSTGLPDENHYTSARDLAILAMALIRDFPGIYELHSVKEFTFNDISQGNRNGLLWKDSSVDGIKTGHTEAAGYCLLSSARRDNMRLISVVMGASSFDAREQASLALFNYGFRFYETRELFSSGSTVTTTRIWKGVNDRVNLGVPDNIFITYPRGQFDEINTDFELPDIIEAPVSRGERLGGFRISLNQKELSRGDLIVIESIAEAGLLGRLKDNIQLIFR